MGFFLNKWFLILLPCFGAVVFVIILRLLNKRHIRNHLKSHSMLSDKEFLAALKVTSKQYGTCLAIRDAAARILKIPNGTLYVSDSMGYLNKMGFDISSFILELESVLSIDIDYDAFYKIISDKKFAEPVTFVDLIHFFVVHLKFFTVATEK